MKKTFDEIIKRPLSILDTITDSSGPYSTPQIAELCRKFNAEASEGQRRGPYFRLLDYVISYLIVIVTKEITDLFSFFDGDSSSLFGNEVRGLDDFELICFLIVR